MTLGYMHAQSFGTDPKHLGFVLARYKFVAKMLADYNRVLEVGCGDGTGANLVRPVVGSLTMIDRDDRAPLVWDIMHGPVPLVAPFDAVYALDVLEHIGEDVESIFFNNVLSNLKDFGVLIIGMPSAESQSYASELSRRYHVNCKTEDQLRASMTRWFHNVFLFGMNDETLHTGFGAMCHYRLAIGAGKR